MNISIPYTRGKFDTRNYTKSGKIKNELYRKPENGLILDNGESSIDMGRTSLENEMGVLNLKTDVKNTNSKIDRAAERQQKNEKTLITKKTTQNCNLSNLSGVIWIGTNKKIAVLVLQPENIFNNVYTIRAGGSFHYKIPLTENVEFPSDSSSQLYNQSAIERQLEFLPAFQMGMTFKILGSDCRLIRQILLNHGFSELSATSQNQTEFNILWAGNHLRSYTLRNLLSFQRVNHFPKSYELTRKDRLFKNIQRMQHTKGFRNFDFIPVSFIMPNEYADFCSVFTRERGVWIAKPVASSRGRGIYLVAHPDQLNLEEHSIVSKYISNPLLIDGFKFDLRLYLAVTSYDPLVAYLYEEGLSRFATVRFDHSVRFIKNACMHLTNYSINKKNHGYVQNSDADIEDVGNKWTLGALLRHLNSNGVDTKQLISKIEDILVRTLLAVQAPISSATKMFTCHHIWLIYSQMFILKVQWPTGLHIKIDVYDKKHNLDLFLKIKKWKQTCRESLSAHLSFTEKVANL
ncbi:hypothetical protein A3Q56_02037 [Intoshia linei]|uniref:Tubulin--tyrosine ligase-like protein 5 n=1 Tax=Intoshia linei TaxID=1819745 RepID=A0A177B760_9BILA|nr:hypothetical protein A3Q56_02037 [Intoshia linei]